MRRGVAETRVAGRPDWRQRKAAGQGWIEALEPRRLLSALMVAIPMKAHDGAVLSAHAIAVPAGAVPPTVSITVTRRRASEVNDGVSKGVGQYTITRVNGDLSQPLTVFYGDGAGTAAGGTDFDTLPGSITLGPNVASATITVVPVPDNVREPTETAILSLMPDANYQINPKKASGTVTITDVEYPPDSLAGLTARLTVSSATGPFSSSGNYQLVFSGSDGRYLRIGASDNLVIVGNFTYHHMTSTVGIVTLDDPTYGNVQGTLTFRSGSAVAFDFGDLMGEQSGKILLAAPKATLAPASLAGRSAKVSLKGGQILPAKGSFQLTLAQDSSDYVSAGAAPVASSFGTCSYERFAPNVGLLTVDDSANADGFIALQFTSAASAAYSAGYMTHASERGTFSLNAIPRSPLVPGTLAGLSLIGKISAGSIPFPATGTFTQAFESATYTVSGSLASTGDYTLEQMTPTLGMLTLNDANGGPEHELVTFAAGNKASLLLFGDTSGSYLRASVAVI